METQIAGSIARMDGSTSQDAIFKDVLAYKEVLAHIMKTCVPEYKDCTIPQIIGYIEPNPQVGQVGLHPDETNPPKIQGMSTESTTTTEERVVYDVRFSAVAPGEDGKIGLIINIEAQSKVPPRLSPGEAGHLLLWADAVGPIRVRVHPIPLRGNSEGIFHLDLHPAA